MSQSSAACGRTFAEELISGYLDGVLTQGDAQRVRLHLEECDECRRLHADLAEVRAAAKSSTFRPLEDEQWNEAPRGSVSRFSRLLGLGLLLLSSLAVVVLSVWQPEELSRLASRLLAVGFVGGLGLLLVSALVDRLRVHPADIYREVKK